MKNNIKIWFIVGASLILIGCILFAGVMSMLKWNFKMLSTVKYTTNTYEIDESFNDISIYTDTADILILPSDNSTCKVVCTDEKSLPHYVHIDEDALSIKIEDKRKWYEYIGINFGSPKITVYLPEGEYGNLQINTDTSDIRIQKDFIFENIDIKGSTADIENYASASNKLKIKTSTGMITVKNVSSGMLDLSASTGNISAQDILCSGDISLKVTTGKTSIKNANCKNLITIGNTGDIILKNTIASELLSVSRSTGDVKFDKCDAGEIFVNTDTGDVTGSLLSAKLFITSSDTGTVKVPETTNGGKCKITTDTGDIKIVISK